MSAYGTTSITAPISSPIALLAPTVWELPEPTAPGKPAPFRRLSLYHLRLDDARALPGLVEYTHRVFTAEVEAGRTYPQEALPHTRASFEAYFWAADVVVAIGTVTNGDGGGGSDDVEAARAGRSWEDTLVGFYYVKPNYPGRSSHICNAGFVIPPPHRQSGYGKTLGRSFLHYAPLLGYKASVFNLVYTNNTGSMRIWDSLGFVRAGLIPRAGRLRREDNSGEEWVDAVIYYRSFVDEDEWASQIE